MKSTVVLFMCLLGAILAKYDAGKYAPHIVQEIVVPTEGECHN